jgi:type II secretory pathway pseudopilin PulG
MEILVVLTIIGILWSTLSPRVSQYVERARVTSILTFEREMRMKGTERAYYDFESVTSTGGVTNVWPKISPTQYDLSHNSGTLVSTGWSFPGGGNAGILHSSTRMVTSGSGIPLSGKDFLVMHWIRSPGTGNWQNYTVLNTGDADGFRFGVADWAGEQRIMFLIGSTTISSHTETYCGDSVMRSKLFDNKWHHIAWVFESSRGVFTCYFDGKLSWSVPYLNPRSGEFIDKPLIVGNRLAISSGFSGSIDDIYIVDMSDMLY